MEPTRFESLYPDDSRFPEIEKILGFVREGNSCQVLSLPGGGRSNLFGLLAYNRKIRIKHLGENQKWFHFVITNFAEVAKKPLFDATKLLFLNLVDSLRERRFEEEYKRADEIFKDCIALDDDLILFGGLKKVMDILAIEKELTVVFLFDRFESYIPMLTPDFFTRLRVLRDRAKYRFSVVFSLNRSVEEMLEPEILGSFYEFVAGHTIVLNLLDKPSLEFRLRYIEKVSGAKLDRDIFTQVLELTKGHGKLTRLSIEVILGSREKGIGSSLQLQTFLLEQPTIKSALLEIWRFLTPEEQTSLENPAFTIPLFEAFVKSLPSEEKEKKFVFEDISDTLSPQEYRLMKLFTENANRVIERDEIVHTVWSDVKTSEGISEAAIDQMIHRLRKKIEQTPATPKHIVTVKGRGFRFAP